MTLFVSFDNSSYFEINKMVSSDYYFEICIPKINLNEKVYNFNDSRNDVDKGIMIVKDYDFYKMKGSLILASHSGNSSISYFKNLYILKKNDIVKILYNGDEYIYQINEIYDINKNGKFKYNSSDKTIYLITCDKNNKKRQNVYKGKLIKIVKKSTFL